MDERSSERDTKLIPIRIARSAAASMSRENFVFSYATVAGVILLFIVGLSWRDLLVEDGLVETLSAAGFAAASLLVVYAAVKKWAPLTRAERIRLHGTRSMISFNAALAYEEVFDVDTTPT